MKLSDCRERVSDVQIAYVREGSRGWARTFMTDLALEPALSGTICLYDIDRAAAEVNTVIGNKTSAKEEAVGKWEYRTCDSLQEALNIQPQALHQEVWRPIFRRWGLLLTR